MPENRLPSMFVPHGAGPCFFMDWNPPGTWERMESWLRGLTGQVGATPKALLVVSAHWEAEVFTVNAQAQPGLLYDYNGFPEHTYRLTWPAPGAPALAAEVGALLAAEGFTVAEDHERGLDHGVFIPMKLAFPEADVPVVQLSLRSGLDPAEHLKAGQALAPLRRQGVLIVGSGMSYHNMAQLRHGGTALDPASQHFDAWLAETVALPPAQREPRLLDWARAPGARDSHPREEHLLPLHVVAGAADGDSGLKVFEDQVLGSVQSAFLFGDTYGQP
ncbi:Extradiol ring-cleavage dioxygenase class III protein subunit B [Nitrosococcus halophilus Nc 4]|uniref:Extradiol ring-cleavage dioxygenase class III protein subunit B n=1 Tax=Nitrosococcus halophilus (strain Nc4) TaxID=472759 RepID=D5C2Z7_NITHN|nr:class III extradiol ring-cleavage dioxygenase [Nitrosococcus halophilus]ADE14889.1 Extradiol ring-cleavage dioxygenase class III protein subunit B [Nitrosococcus halophilus Nc 4]